MSKQRDECYLAEARRAVDAARAETHGGSEPEPLERTIEWAADVARAKALMAETDATLTELLAEQRPSQGYHRLRRRYFERKYPRCGTGSSWC
jgi:hypothetical protein